MCFVTDTGAEAVGEADLRDRPWPSLPSDFTFALIFPQSTSVADSILYFLFSLSLFLFLFLFFFVFFFFRAAPTACGGVQARGQIESELQLLAYTTATAPADP